MRMLDSGKMSESIATPIYGGHDQNPIPPQKETQSRKHTCSSSAIKCVITFYLQSCHAFYRDAENGFMGMGIGAAMTGLRPIIEGMNMGFLLLAFNQISNNCGMLHYTSGGQYRTPVVIRGPGGVGRQLGAEHSQRLESYFQSIPGVQLVACSTVANAKALLKSVRSCESSSLHAPKIIL